jgi:hypothetical protein
VLPTPRLPLWLVGWVLLVVLTCVLAVGARHDTTVDGAQYRALGVPDGPTVWLPFAVTGRRGIRSTPVTAPLRTATAAARTATAAARTPPRPSSTATASATVAVTATPRATSTATAVDTAIATVTASPSPGVSPTPRDPLGDRILPLGAMREGSTGTSFDASRRTWHLRYSGAIDVGYEVDLTHPDIVRGRLSIREETSGRYPVAGAGLYYRRLDGTLVEPWLTGRLVTVDAVEAEALPEGDGVRLDVRETIEGIAHAKRYTLRIAGRALAIHAESRDAPGASRGAYAGFTAGDVAGSSDAINVRLPYMDAVPVTMLDHRYFASTLLDVTHSHAGQLAPRGPEAIAGGFTNEVVALYPPDAEGTVRPVDELVWVIVSPDVADAFPVPLQAPSPHRAQLVGKPHVTLLGRSPEVTFAQEAAYLARLRTWGVTDVVVDKRHWRDETVLRPAQGPADPAAGGMPGLVTLVAAAAILAPSQAYTETVEPCDGETSLFYHPEDRVLGSDGTPKRLLEEAGGTRDCPGGLTAGRYLLAPDAARRIAVDEGAGRSVPGAGAVFLETLTAWNPAYAWPGAEDNVVDQTGGGVHPGTVAEAIAAYKALFGDLQASVGPVFGAGASGSWYPGYDSLYAGYVDGVARSLSTGSDEQSAGDPYLVVPDYEVIVVRPRMVNYGMGGYARFFESYPPGGEVPEAFIDAWRATTLAYGHVGAWEAVGAPVVPEPLTPAETLKEYALMTALSRRYTDAPSAEVRYIDAEEQSRDLSWALAHDLDLSAPRLHVDYGSIDVWVNHDRDDWTVDVAGNALVLPTHGWLARADDGLLAYSARVDGRQVDYLAAPEVTLLDGRGEVVRIGAIQARDLKVVWADGSTIEEMPDGSLQRLP